MMDLDQLEVGDPGEEASRGEEAISSLVWLAYL